MSASTESQDQAVGVSERPPSDKQLRYLRSLVLQRGESFGYPRTSAEASAEINRLKQRRPSSFTERRIEREQVISDNRGAPNVGVASDAKLSHRK